ncbi:MAG: mandelate racemase [Armatimonadetes bacterium]|nr:mandelate racemase [Armatimonadota bacterium]
MSTPLTLRVHEVGQSVRNVRTRLPFRYGKATLTRVPVLHLRTIVEDSTGRRAEGWSADCLPPGWFDKRPGRTFRDDITSLRGVVDDAAEVYLQHTPDTAFALWYAAYLETRQRGLTRGENGLTCGFGPALVERSVMDAAGKLAGTPVYRTVRDGLLGLDLSALHPELRGSQPSDFLSPEPLETVGLRQTIGLLDPLTAADIPAGGDLGDGLPQTLEDYLLTRGLRYVKLKLGANLAADMARVRTVAALLDRHVAGRYVVSLDGNELYPSPAAVLGLLDRIASEPTLTRFFHAVEYVEQPFPRDLSLDPAALAGLGELTEVKPVVIDESDDSIDAFRRAVELGYQGISIKNCKGVTKAVANRALAAVFNAARSDAPYFLTCEDLMNTAFVPVQQDLATAAMLGVPHVERNGHHYVRGLDHCSSLEIAELLERHATLYEPFGGSSGQLRICEGLLDLRSLAVPGYAVAVEPDWSFLTPIADWRYEDLGLDD